MGAYGQGTYLDGSPWLASNNDTVTIGLTEPATASVARLDTNGNPTENEVPGQNGVYAPTGPTVVHGMMLNPGNAALHGETGDKSTLAGKQQFNFGFSGSGTQSYDSFTGVQSTYSSYRSASNMAGAPVALSEGTLVKAISQLTDLPRSGRGFLTGLVPLTVVPGAPPANSFRPATAPAAKTHRWTLSSLRMDRLPSLASTGLTPLDHTAYMAKMDYQPWQHTYNVAARNLATVGAPGYGGDRFDYALPMLALCYDFWTTNQKLDMVIKLVQLGIDIAGRVEEGAVYISNGGHCAGYKPLVAFAAYMLNDDPYLQGILNTVALGPNYNAPAVPVGQSIWADDLQYFTLTQPLIDAQAATALPYTQNQLGWPEWGGDSVYENPKSYLNHMGSTPGDYFPTAANNSTYRHVIAAVQVPFALALRLMGAKPLYNNQVWFDYQDRYMLWYNAGMPSSGNAQRAFSLAAWNLSRGTSGLWTI